MGNAVTLKDVLAVAAMAKERKWARIVVLREHRSRNGIWQVVNGCLFAD